MTSYFSALQYCEIAVIRFHRKASNEFPADVRLSAYQSQRHLFDRFVSTKPSEKFVYINHVDAEIQF